MNHLKLNLKKAASFYISILVFNFSKAQNVGIGITSPTEKLHIYNPSGSLVSNVLYMQNASDGGRNVIRMRSATGNPFQISKISQNEFVSSAGVLLSGGVIFANDDNGPIVFNTGFFPQSSIHFATSNKMRLTVDGTTGAVLLRPASLYNFTGSSETDFGIRRDTANEMQSWMELRDSSSNGNISGFMSTNASLDGYGPRIQFGNNSFGNSKITFWTNTYSPQMFIHENGNVGLGLPTFADPGAKLYVNGQVKITDGNQLNGRVLTTDNAGLARWQDLPSSATSWAVSGNNINNTNSGNVGIGTSTFDANTKLQLLVNSGEQGFVKFQTTSTSKGIGLGFKNPNGEWLLGQNIGNFPDDRFNLVYTSSVGGAKYAMTATKDGYVGIGEYTGVAAPTERLEIRDGFMKVSGASKTAFTITATGGNSSGHILNLSYANQASTDILIVTHNYNPSGGPSAYHNYNVGVYWNGGNWTIYNENTSIPILGISFNVLVIKQ